MNKYQKNNVIIVIVTAFVLLIASAVIYFFHFYKSPTEKETKDKLYVEVTDESTINELAEVIKNNKFHNIDKLERNIDNFNTIETNEKLDIGFNSVFESLNDPYSNGIDAFLIDEYFNNTFKTIIYWDKTNIHCECGKDIFLYDISQNKYVYNDKHLGHGAFVVDNYYSKIIDVKKKNNKYVVTMIKLWVGYDSLFEPIRVGYSNYMDALYNENPLFEIEFEYENDKSEIYYAVNELEDNLEKYQSQMSKYIYTFEKEENSYKLVTFKFEE